MHGLALILIAAALWGVGAFFSKVAVASVSPWTTSLVRSAVFFPLVAGFVLSRTRVSARIDRPTAYAAGAGALVGVTILSTRFALTAYEVSLVAPIRRVGLLVTVGLSALLLDEALTPRKLLGVAAALAALFLLSPR